MRSIDEEVKLKPATKIPKGKLNALRVMQCQEFNQDDTPEGEGQEADAKQGQPSSELGI